MLFFKRGDLISQLCIIKANIILGNDEVSFIGAPDSLGIFITELAEPFTERLLRVECSDSLRSAEIVAFPIISIAQCDISFRN